MFSDSQRKGDGFPRRFASARLVVLVALLALAVLVVALLAGAEPGGGAEHGQARASRLIASAARGFWQAHPAAAPAAKCTVPAVKKLTSKKAASKLKAAGCGKPKIKKIFSSKIK